jgi:hypothetical protein
VIALRGVGGLVEANVLVEMSTLLGRDALDGSGSDGLSEKIRIHLGHTDQLVVIDHNADAPQLRVVRLIEASGAVLSAGPWPMYRSLMQDTS